MCAEWNVMSSSPHVVPDAISRTQMCGHFVAPIIRDNRPHLCFPYTCSITKVPCRNKQSLRKKSVQFSEVGIHSSKAELSSTSLVSDEEDGNGEFSEDDTFETNNPNHRSGYVAVIGRPNVGKSTLVNQLVGEKMSIVTAKPQTTRHRILGLCSGPDYQIILYDTPGIIEKSMHKLDGLMMKNVRRAKFDAECAVVVVDVSKTPERVDESLEKVIGNLKGLQTLLVLNKKDLLKPGEISKKLEWFEKFTNVDDVIPVSSKYAEGIIDVKCWIISKLPHGPAYYPKEIISEHPEKFFIAEIVREKILMLYRHEIPYACQVEVVEYISRPKGKDYIKVEILVEKTSQKIILIGKEGRALKSVAMASRVDVEELVGKGVYLEVHVKVKEAWRKDEMFLKNHGYLDNMG